jgi:hypothetical protein
LTSFFIESDFTATVLTSAADAASAEKVIAAAANAPRAADAFLLFMIFSYAG